MADLCPILLGSQLCELWYVIAWTYLVENKGDRHEKHGNTAEERITWTNTELREQLARLKHDLRLVTESQKDVLNCLQTVEKKHQTRRERVRILRIWMRRM